jgi:hypothetical protein
VSAAVDTLQARPIEVCAAIGTVLPLLRLLREGRRFWLRWGMGVLISALESYHAEQCGS